MYKRQVYRVSFPAVLGFRVMDCDDFFEELRPGGVEGGGSTFRMRNSANPLHILSTVEDGAWSYVIATDDECLEVAVMGEDDVDIRLVREVERVPRKWMGIFQRD